jgi:hypothetical protein
MSFLKGNFTILGYVALPWFLVMNLARSPFQSFHLNRGGGYGEVQYISNVTITLIICIRYTVLKIDQHTSNYA